MATSAKKKKTAAVENDSAPDIVTVEAAKKVAKPRASRSTTAKAAKPRSKKKETENLLFKDEKPSTPILTHEEISVRAYFIAEERAKTGRHGDPHGDWLEAERQLLAERGC